MARTADRLTALRVVCLLPALVVLPMTASAQLSLDWYTIDGGGHTFSTGGALSLGGTVGQPDAGSAEGGEYALLGGFWVPSHGDASNAPEASTEQEAPLAFRVAAGMPNPFRDATRLEFDLPNDVPVSVLVFDPAGRRVRTMHNGWMAAGRHTLMWRGDSDSGHRAPAGVYLMLLRAGQYESHHRLILLQ